MSVIHIRMGKELLSVCLKRQSLWYMKPEETDMKGETILGPFYCWASKKKKNQDLGQVKVGLFQSLKVNCGNLSSLKLDPKKHHANPLRKWGLASLHVRFHMDSGFGSTDGRVAEGVSWDWQARSPWEFRKAPWNGFPTHCNFGSVLLLSMNLGENNRVGYMVQIIFQAGRVFI